MQDYNVKLNTKQMIFLTLLLQLLGSFSVLANRLCTECEATIPVFNRLRFVNDSCIILARNNTIASCECCDMQIHMFDFMSVKPGCNNVLGVYDADMHTYAHHFKDTNIRIANVYPDTLYCIDVLQTEECGDTFRSQFTDPNTIEYNVVDVFSQCCFSDVVDFECCECPPLPPPPPMQAIVRPPPPMQAIVRPPPPVMNINGFPWCNCDRTTTSQMSLRYEGLQGDAFCFNIWTRSSCVDDQRCCAFDLYKIEFPIRRECIGSVTSITVQGEKKSSSYDWKTNPVFKITNLNIPFQDVDSVEVCLTMRPPCNDLNVFCAHSECTYALLENKNKPGGYCCAVGNALVS